MMAKKRKRVHDREVKPAAEKRAHERRESARKERREQRKAR